MGKYEAAFSRLGEEALVKLEGPGGFLAVTEAHLVFVDDAGVKRLELSRIRRVGKGEAGTLLVQGEGDSLVLPLKAFPLEELKAFLEGLKPHVARARKATFAPPPAPGPQAPPPEAIPSPPSSRPPLWEEEAPPKPPFGPGAAGNPTPRSPAEGGWNPFGPSPKASRPPHPGLYRGLRGPEPRGGSLGPGRGSPRRAWSGLDGVVLGYLLAVALLALFSLWPKLVPKPQPVWVETLAEASFEPPAPEPISLNQASLEELMSLPGVGPVLAQRIVAGRPYARVEDLLRVKGIGPATLERLRPYVRP